MTGFTIMTIIASGAIVLYAKAQHDLAEARVKIERLERWYHANDRPDDGIPITLGEERR